MLVIRYEVNMIIANVMLTQSHEHFFQQNAEIDLLHLKRASSSRTAVDRPGGRTQRCGSVRHDV